MFLYVPFLSPVFYAYDFTLSSLLYLSVSLYLSFLLPREHLFPSLPLEGTPP